jgi:hypothetical protein
MLEYSQVAAPPALALVPRATLDLMALPALGVWLSCGGKRKMNLPVTSG